MHSSLVAAAAALVLTWERGLFFLPAILVTLADAAVGGGLRARRRDLT